MMSNTAVVIPAFNEEVGIARTIESILGQTEAPASLYVVDNASNDQTSNIVERYSDDVTLIHEPVKGTGTACGTGFARAIADGAELVARTDADSVPHDDWIAEIQDYFNEHAEKQLVSGPSLPLNDEYYKSRDALFLPAGRALYKMSRVIMTASMLPARIAIGHNMAIRADAYEQIDGFANTSIAELDEDIDLTLQVYNQFGYKALGYNRDMKVDTSMRRFRKVGYIGMNSYYKNPFKAPVAEDRLRVTDGDVDIR